MTLNEISETIAYLTAAYPTFKLDDVKVAMLVWQDQFREDDGRIVEQAVRAIVSSSERQFAPSIGEIKSMMRKLTQKAELTEGEAWAMVERAISQSSYYAEEEFNKLPEDIQRAVGSPSQLEAWAKDSNYCSGVVQSHFLTAYESAKKQRETLAQLPNDIRLAITQGLAQIGARQ